MSASTTTDLINTAPPPKRTASKRTASDDLISARPLVGRSQAIQQLRQQVNQLSHSVCNVLITGESGAGKERIARNLHAHGRLHARPFVPVDCGSLSGALFESQLFGHVKGAFTGADRDTLGFWRAADGGTLFFDEIGELSLDLQVKLLRCLQEKAVTPVGATRPIPVSVRVIAATNRDLHEMVEEGSFREDLYYRLNVVCVNVPPLRDRRADIPELLDQFLHEVAGVYQQPIKTLADDATAAFLEHDWPGNVRELENAVEYLYAMHTHALITHEDLPQTVRIPRESDPIKIRPLDAVQRDAVASALRATEGNQAQAARLLEIDTRRLYRMVDRYDLRELTQYSRA